MPHDGRERLEMVDVPNTGGRKHQVTTSCPCSEGGLKALKEQKQAKLTCTTLAVIIAGVRIRK